MKIKIFSGNDIRALELAVNEFIKDKHVISIQPSQYLSNRPNLTIIIMYDDTFNSGYVRTNLEKEILDKMDGIIK